MARNKKTTSSKNLSGGKPKAEAKGTQRSAKDGSVLVTLDNWFKPRLFYVFGLSLFLALFFGIFLFDFKISTGGDDSHYIEMAHNFITGKSFPTWHGPLYSIFLSIPILIFGVNVVILKLVSFACILVSLVLFYFTFRNQISATVLALILLILSVNSSLLYFASHTYSEAMYLMLQSLVIFLFVQKYMSGDKLTDGRQQRGFLFWAILALLTFFVSLTRNIGFTLLISIVLIILADKNYKVLLKFLGSFAAYVVLYKLYRSIVWNSNASSGQRPYSEIFLKNFYNSAEGYEDFSGMVVRFFENARLYLSKHLMIGIGLHDPTSTEKSWFVTVVVILLLLISLYYAYKRNKVIFFVTFYSILSSSATFLALQQSWDQMRMVIIYLPIVLVAVSWGVLQTAENKKLKFLYLFVPLFLAFVFTKTLGQTSDKVRANRKALSINLKGNLYYGFTPDWQNFLMMSKWVGENLPDTVMVASRKPSMSYIYSGGRDFYGIFRFPVEEPKKLVDALGSRVGEMVVIPDNALDRACPPDVRQRLKASVVGYVAEGSDIYGLYRTGTPEGDAVAKAVTDYKMPSVTPDSLLRRISLSSQQCFAVSPDSLVHALRRNKVSYVIVASLRANPNMNTGNIINNIQRYLYFVELKYPGILSLVHQIGNSEADEPAWLYQLNYQIYGL